VEQVHHQYDERVEAHIYLTILADQLVNTATGCGHTQVPDFCFSSLILVKAMASNPNEIKNKPTLPGVFINKTQLSFSKSKRLRINIPNAPPPQTNNVKMTFLFFPMVYMK
jgi:hypothetical protein